MATYKTESEIESAGYTIKGKRAYLYEDEPDCRKILDCREFNGAEWVTVPHGIYG